MSIAHRIHLIRVYIHGSNKRCCEYYIIRILILIFILAAVSAKVFGQKYKSFDNTIALTVCPGQTLGVGLKYNYKPIYITASRGSYSLPDGGYLADHYRTSIGYCKHVTIDRITKLKNLYSIGLVYNYYGNPYYKSLTLNPDEFFPVSVEIGAGMNLARLSGMIRMDFIKWEIFFDFGFNF